MTIQMIVNIHGSHGSFTQPKALVVWRETLTFKSDLDNVFPFIIFSFLSILALLGYHSCVLSLVVLVLVFVFI